MQSVPFGVGCRTEHDRSSAIQQPFQGFCLSTHQPPSVQDLSVHIHLVVAMQDANLGQNLAVLRGHTKPVHSIAFHPDLPTALLSASADNTVRLWDASDQHVAHLVLRPGQHAVWESNLPPAANASAQLVDQVWAPEQPTAAAAAGAAAAATAGAGDRAPGVQAAAGETICEVCHTTSCSTVTATVKSLFSVSADQSTCAAGLGQRDFGRCTEMQRGPSTLCLHPQPMCQFLGAVQLVRCRR